ARAQGDLRPRDLTRDTIDQMDRGTRLLEVHEVGEVDARERARRLALLLQDRDAAAPGEPGVDPARERDDEHRFAQLRERVDLDHLSNLRGRRVGSAVVIFGVHAGLQYTSTDAIQSLWRRIEELGFRWISVWDHFYAADVTDPNSGYECLEGLTAHAALAMATTRVRCGSLVYCAGYRHPAVMANSIATIDNFADGRVTLGLGAGWHQGEFDAYGIPF